MIMLGRDMRRATSAKNFFSLIMMVDCMASRNSSITIVTPCKTIHVYGKEKSDSVKKKGKRKTCKFVYKYVVCSLQHCEKERFRQELVNWSDFQEYHHRSKTAEHVTEITLMVTVNFIFYIAWTRSLCLWNRTQSQTRIQALQLHYHLDS